MSAAPPELSLTAAIDAAEWPRALGLAIDAWREARDPALADLVDRIAARCIVPVPASAVADSWRAARWWIEQAMRPYDPLLATALLDRIDVTKNEHDVTWEELQTRWSGHPLRPTLEPYKVAGYEPPNWVDRAAFLMTWPDDPRVATVLAAWLTGHLGFAQRDFVPMYRVIIDHLVKLADARVLAQLDAFLAEPPPDDRWLASQQEVAEARARLERVLADLPSPRAEHAALHAALPPSDLERLWDALGEQPDDLATRAVLGDALVARQDPRGELFQLQLSLEAVPGTASDPRLAEIRRLLDREWEHWFGTLDQLLDREGCEVRRGMLEVISVGFRNTPRAAWRDALRHRELRAVHTVRPFTPVGLDYAAFVAALPNLCTLAIHRLDTAVALVTHGARLGITCLEYRNDDVRHDAAAAAAEVDSTLRVFARLARLAPAVERIILDAATFRDRLDRIPSALRAMFPALTAVDVSR